MYDYLIILLLITGGLTLLLGLKIYQLPRTPATKALILLSVATALWSIGYGIELGSPNLEATLFWAKVEYLGIVTIPVAWFLFSFSYSNLGKRFSFFRGRFLLLWIIPGLTLALVMPDSTHHLVWDEILLERVGHFSTLSFSYGAWFWIHLFYSYALLLVGSVFLVVVLIQSIHFHRWQVSLVLIAIAVPWIANILYISDSGWLPALDFTPFAFFISCLLLVISLFGFKLASLRPIPRMAMVDSMLDGLVVLDPGGRILDLNASARKIIGRSGGKLIGQNFFNLFPEARAQITLTKTTESKSTLMIGEGAESQSFQMVISPLVNQIGDLQNKLVSLRQIDRQVQTARSNGIIDQIQEIVELEPDAMLLVNLERKIILVNNQAERSFGYMRKEMRQLSLDALIPERFRHQHQANVSQFFTNPIARPMGTSLSLYALKKDGSEFPVDINLTPLNMGEELLVACAVRDISKQKQIERALQEREDTYRALFESANDAIFLLSETGGILEVNQRAADLLGYAREELVGLGVSDIVVPEERDNAYNRLRDLMSGIKSQLYERTFQKKDGSTIPVEINVSLLHNAEGKLIFIQSIVRDISERKRLEQELLNLLAEIKQSQEDLRALEEHLVQVSEEERRALAAELHDRVGQNLTVLNLNLNIISKQLYKNDYLAFQTRLEDSIELVEETSRLVRNVMADLRPPMLDDYGLFSALRWYCDKFTQRTNIKTSLTGEECQPRLSGHVELVLFRIVQEMLNNITKHAQADRVIVSLDSTVKSVLLSVEDNGVGFDPAKPTNFNQEPHLGMLNMQERARSVGGRLNIVSAPGQGTKISVELQREAGDD